MYQKKKAHLQLFLLVKTNSHLRKLAIILLVLQQLLSSFLYFRIRQENEDCC